MKIAATHNEGDKANNHSSFMKNDVHVYLVILFGLLFLTFEKRLEGIL